VTLSWTAPGAQPANLTISSYTIVRTGGTGGAVTSTLAAGATGFIDSTAVEHTTYSYAVNAVNNTGLTPVPGAASTATVTTLYAAPGVLTGLSASVNASGNPAQVTLNWTGVAPVSNALIERCTATAANANCTAASSVWLPAWTVVSTVGPNSYLDSTVIDNTSYVYRVRSQNGTAGTPAVANLSAPQTVIATTPAVAGLVVSAPTGLTAVVAFATNRINLTWTDTATNETAFVIERSTDGVNFAQVGTAAARVGTPAVAGTAGQTRTFADAAVSAGQTYYYRVKAENLTGAVTTQSVPTAVVKVDYFLVAPTLSSATIASATRITLNWIDNSTAETGFAVWRSDNGAAAVQIGTVTRTAAQGAATGGAAVTFNNNNSVATPLVLGHTYTYTVTAVNGAVSSTASNAVSTSFAAPAAPATPTAAVALNTATRATVTVSWAAVPGATSYTVQRIAPNGTTSTVVTNTALLTVTQTNVVRNATQPYVYQVRANGLAGSSAYTPVSQIVN
jgi:titin